MDASSSRGHGWERAMAGSGALPFSREACEQANSLAQPSKTRREREEEKAAKKRIKQLERELRRKDAALAETAALLVLRKKAEALWGKDEDE